MQFTRRLTMPVAVAAAIAAVLPAAERASAAAPTLSPSASHHYRVHGAGAPALPSLSRGVMVRTGGAEFVVGQRLADAKTKTYRMVFLAHRHGSNHWTEHVRTASSPQIYKYTTYSAQVSPDGKRVVIEVNSCAKDKLYVIEAPTSKKFGTDLTTRLAESGNNYTCEFPTGSRPTYAPFMDAATLPHHRVTLVFSGLPDPTYSHTNYGVVAISTGSVAHGFPAPHALSTPPGDVARPTSITRDPITGEITVLANSQNGTHGIYAYNQATSGAWSGPASVLPPVQVTSAQNDYEEDGGIAVTARRGHVTAWVCRFPNASSDPDDGDPLTHATCGTVDRGSGGKWGAFTPYPGLTDVDYQSVIATMIANPTTGSVHLLWTTTKDRDTTLRQAVRAHGKWDAPQTLLRVRHGVIVDLSAALSAAGHPVEGFRIYG